MPIRFSYSLRPDESFRGQESGAGRIPGAAPHRSCGWTRGSVPVTSCMRQLGTAIMGVSPIAFIWTLIG